MAVQKGAPPSSPEGHAIARELRRAWVGDDTELVTLGTVNHPSGALSGIKQDKYPES